MIYLDNAATTPMDSRVTGVLKESIDSDFANSGTVYSIGLDARRKIEQAQEDIARALNIPSTHRIIFTSGGSEANNLFIKGLCFPDKRTACLGLEHPSVREPLNYLESFGNDSLSLLEFQTEGRLDLKAVSALNENRVRLLCLSHINNELGAVNDPVKISGALKKGSSGTRLFMDGVQAIGKLKLDASQWSELAGYSISAHKCHGPKGVGLLIYDSRLSLEPIIHGGSQQHGVRSGTLPVPLIRAMVETVKIAVECTDETLEHLRKLNRRLIKGLIDLSARLDSLNIRFNSLSVDDVGRQSPAIVNFGFSPVEGEVLLHHLEEKEIFVGLGSACSAHSKEPSKILTGIGLSEEEARCSLRISFSKTNTVEEVDRFLEEFAQAYEVLFPTFHNKLAER